MTSLKGKKAIITGSTSGIGWAMAEALAREGASVVLCGLGTPEDIQQKVAHLQTTYNVPARFDDADMRNPQTIARMVETTATQWGGVDILINNAGIQHVAPLDDFPPHMWDAILAINLSAVFHGIRAVLPLMKAQKWGRIITTASAHSLVASPYKAPYVATKHAVAGLTKAVALEVATQGITVNCISPGYVWTSLVEQQIPDTMATRNLTRDEVINDVLLKAQPTKEFVQVEQVAALAVFLCSEAARNMTGGNISMDGGWTAQ